MRNGRAIILSDYIGGEGAGSGGAGHAALDSYHALLAAGADVRAIAGFGTAEDIRSLHGEDLRTGGIVDSARAIYNPQARQRLAAALDEEDPETTIVILHQWTRYLSPAALGFVSRFPTMIYMHEYFWPCPNGLYYDFSIQRPCTRRPMGVPCLAASCDRHGRVQKIGRVVRQAVRQTLTRGNAKRRLFLHLSEQARRTAAPLLSGERHTILYNSLPPTDGASEPVLAPRYDVGYFGRLEADKGVAILADAVARHGLAAMFVGQGSLEKELATVPGVECRAWQPRATMAAAMRSCAAVALPSLWHETWGLIIPEAMAAGVPVLVSDRAGSAELVRRFGGGATFDPGRNGDLGDKLAALLAANPAPKARLTELRRFLSPERHAERIIELAGIHFGLDLRDRAKLQACSKGSRQAECPPLAM